ncbi:30S ribosome-binding factor RbfA [Candidatus Nomurabacteria bacterium]|nr:30S ribosome-binding factor RbfA [Candidatus Nomurabacteria bacterium]
MSRRTEQVAELLRQEINQVLVKDFEAPLGSLIGVSEVEVAPDLKHATAYLSIIPSNKIGSGLQAVEKFSGHIQKKINQNLKMRSVPKIHWQLDQRDLKYKIIEDAIKD